jgi:retron-type reverse transcriptase
VQAGALTDEGLEATVEGTPPGGPRSPLLANLLLDELDKELERRGRPGAVPQWVGRLLDAFLAACKARGWIKARGTQRTDSTHVLAAIRILHRLECVLEAMHYALN